MYVFFVVHVEGSEQVSSEDKDLNSEPLGPSTSRDFLVVSSL